MLFSPRIRLKSLAQLCQRLATATRAGLGDRRIWRSEAERGGAWQRAHVGDVSDQLDRGVSVADAIAHTGDYFPRMFRQVVAIGDATGQLDRAYRKLAEHYEHMIAARRTFFGALAWPAIQLGLALVVIGIVIWISGALGLKDMQGEPLDMFGFGLIGHRGLMLYIAALAFLAICLLLFIEASRRGMLWTRFLERSVLRVPVIGGAIRTLALARFTWALQLVLDTAMDLRKAFPLALDATGNDYYRRQGPRIARSIEQGMSITQALAATGAFPRELLDAIEVGEQSGMLAETMQRQSTEYRQRAAMAISVLAQAFGYLVWIAVAVFIIMLIFRVFSMYVGTIESLTKPM
jgi:type II secretory pathway component PulF